MQTHRTLAITVIGLLIALGLQACNLPAARQAQTPAAPDLTLPAESTAGASAPTADASTPAAGNATPTASAAEGGLPPGWVAQPIDALGLNVATPEGWELEVVNDTNAHLRETGGEGWLQLMVLNAENAGEMGLDYQPQTSAVEMLSSLLVAFREDGDFTAAQPVDTAGGLAAATSEGQYQPYGERLMLTVVTLPDRAVFLIGHGPALDADPDAAWARLQPIYADMVQSVEVTE